jgi:hypothetical protein
MQIRVVDISLKNRILVICPLFSIGASTGLAPIQVSITRTENVLHMIAFSDGLFFFLCCFFLFIIGVTNTIIDMANAITPPIFDGIDRRIA